MFVHWFMRSMRNNARTGFCREYKIVRLELRASDARPVGCRSYLSVRAAVAQPVCHLVELQALRIERPILVAVSGAITESAQQESKTPQIEYWRNDVNRCRC